jgi:hypothetical protein
MIKNSHKTSLLIPSQLPEFIRDNPDYEKFVAFIQAYYEWLELSNTANAQSTVVSTTAQGATYAAKNILNYADIDRTTDEFLNYYINDFLPNFPSDALVDKRLAVKVAKQLYELKGTPASYQFLFRVLYNSDFDVFYTKDAVLKASDGIWYVAKSLRLATTDTRFLNTNNLRVFGEKSGSIATIENSVAAETKIEVFISNIERTFESGEMVRIVDNANQTLYFDEEGNIVDKETPGATYLRAKLVGQISQIKIDPKNRGLYYRSGDPVIVYGGIDEETENPVEATAIVGQTTKGSIQRISVVDGGFGYRPDPNTRILITNIEGAIAHVGEVDPDEAKDANVTVAIDTITLKRFTQIGNTNYKFANGYIFVVSANNTNPNTFIVGETVYQGSDVTSASFISTVKRFNTASNTLYLNTSSGLPANGSPIKGSSSNANRTINVLYGANSNTTLANAFSYANFLTYPIATVIVDNGGGGATQKPEITADSIYSTDCPVQAGNDEFGIAHLARLGMLGPVLIANGGKGYQVNDKIVFSGGSGYGAFANVTVVNADGSINTVSYVSGTYLSSNNRYPLGGLGYRNDYLPILSVNSANAQASNASLYVPCILGTSAILDPTTDRIGAITTITVTEYGEDYSARPNVSIRVQDILVSNLNISVPPRKNDVAYQGANVNVATFSAYVDSFSLVVPYGNPVDSQYNIRLYNYNGTPNTSQVIKILDKNISLIPANTFIEDTNYNENGIKVYGDGRAKGTATFLNGLTLGEGQYISGRGLVSGYDVLQDENFNNFTYKITVQKEIEKYRETLLNLLHPAGLKVLGRYALKANSDYRFHSLDASFNGYPLNHYTNYLGSTATITTNFNNISNNIVKFNDLAGANIGTFIFSANSNPNPFGGASILKISTTKGVNVWATVINVDYVGNNVTIGDNVVLTFANVAIATANAGSNVINILNLTGAYDLYNNGRYSNTQYPLKDIVYAGDTIKIGGNTGVIGSVNYESGIIILTTAFAANANTYMSVARAFTADAQKDTVIYRTIGTQYYPELVTEDLRNIVTEDELIILLG